MTETQEELETMQEGIGELEGEMSRLKVNLDEKSKVVDDAKRVASKAAKALEQAEKEISSRVRVARCGRLHKLTTTSRAE